MPCPSRQPRTSNSLLDLALTAVNVTLLLGSISRYCPFIFCVLCPSCQSSFRLSAIIRNISRRCPENPICIFHPLSFTPYSSNTSRFFMWVVHSDRKWIAHFSESADLRRAASKGDMIDSIVDRLYRPSRISNRMRLAKLLLMLLLEGNGYDPSIHISSSIRCHHRRATATSQAPPPQANNETMSALFARVGKIRMSTDDVSLYIGKSYYFLFFCVDVFCHK